MGVSAGVSAAHIEAALRAVGAVGGQRWSYEELAEGANVALAASGITTDAGAAVFLAQCMVESAYFRTTTEYSYTVGTPGWHNMQRYAPYIGRGFLQITWRANYAAFGAWCREQDLVPDANYFVDGPTRLAEPTWAWLGAVWYFTANRLVDLANSGHNVRVGRAVNRGNANSPAAAYGEDHRQAAYRALISAGVSAPPVPSVQEETDMPSLEEIRAELTAVIRAHWSEGVNVPGEQRRRSRNQMLVWSYLRAGSAARDSQKALAISREVARRQGMTEQQLNAIEAKVDELADDDRGR